jgi:signal peptidase I
MEPNFHEGQYVFVTAVGDLQRGAVVVFENPRDEGHLLFKRIIGLPGETVSVHPGQVYINGLPLEENYLYEPFRFGSDRDWVLGMNEYFVLGDNRNNSSDSFEFGPITRDMIMGRITYTYWPPELWGAVSRPTYTIDE